jgi:UMF1 family MFS transporter
VQFLGRTFDRASLASYSIAFSFLVIAFLSPILSSIADYKGNKKAFMQFFCYLGSAACIGLTFMTKENITFGIVCSILGSIGFCGSIVFYNAYLPEIAAEGDQDKVSAKGFAMGYIGSVLLMVICLAFIMTIKGTTWPVRLSFLAVGFCTNCFSPIASFKALATTSRTQHIYKWVS